MQIVRSRNGVPIRLTDERWLHIVQRHPVMAELRPLVLEVVEQPDMLQQGDWGELLAIRFCRATPAGAKFVVVAYREVAIDDGFVVTAYLTNRPSPRRPVLWTR